MKKSKLKHTVGNFTTLEHLKVLRQYRQELLRYVFNCYDMKLARYEVKGIINELLKLNDYIDKVENL